MKMVYKQTTPYTCGPCAYINSFGLDIDKVQKYHEIGRIKPSKLFLGISFLEINPKLLLFIEDLKISQKIIDLIERFEGLKNIKKRINIYYNTLIEKHKKDIKSIKKPKDIVNELNLCAEKNKKAIVLVVSNWYKVKAPHWIAFKGKEGTKYLFADSYTGKILKFTEDEILKLLSSVKSFGFLLQMVREA